MAYHDHEWGRPVGSDRRLYEKICLEGFQAGMAWITILRKRDNFRAAFFGFDIDKVAAMTEADVERLLGDAGIVRHRGKIASTINNAKKAQELRAEFGSLAAYFWGYEPASGIPVVLLSYSGGAQVATGAVEELFNQLRAPLWLITLADLTALGFTGPIFVTIGAALFLAEDVRLRRWIAVIVGFAGAMIIIRPGFGEIHLGVICILVSTPIFSASALAPP